MKKMSLLSIYFLCLFLFSCENTVSIKDADDTTIKKKMAIADTTNIPNDKKISYYEDAFVLALKDIQSDEKMRTSVIEIPIESIERYYFSLLHIFKDSTIAAQDSVVRIYNVHCFPVQTREIIIGLDSTVDWNENWKNLNRLTGNKEIDELVQKYDLQIESYNDRFPTNWAVLRSARQLNIEALAFLFKNIKGVKWAEPNGYLGDGKNISGSISNEYVELIYSYGFGDCPSGCIYRHYWKFQVNYNGTVKFLGSYGSKLQPK